MALEKYLTVSTYFCRTDFANESKQSKTCVYAFLTGILGWGQKINLYLAAVILRGRESNC